MVSFSGFVSASGEFFTLGKKTKKKKRVVGLFGDIPCANTVAGSTAGEKLKMQECRSNR
jgi:hypothetical protein